VPTLRGDASGKRHRRGSRGAAEGICQDQVGPGSNRFMRLKYVGLEKAPNKTLFLALHPDNRASVIGADQKIGEN